MGNFFYWPIVLLLVAPLSPLLHGEGPPPFEERSLSAPALQRVAGCRRAADWELDSLTAVALYLHGDMEIAQAQAATAEAGITTAGTRPNPSLSLVPQTTTPLRTYKNGTYSTNLDLPIETAGKRGWRLEQSRKMAEASRALLDSTAWQLRGRVRTNLVALYAARQRSELRKSSAAQHLAIGESMRRRVEAGESSRPEMLQIRLLHNQAELAAADAVKQDVEARAALADAIGVPLAGMEGVELELTPFARLPGLSEAEGLVRNALARRSDLAAARAERDAAVAAVRSELARRYPDLHLLPGYSYDDGRNKVELGFSFELPIFNQNKGLIAEARGRVAEAEARWHSAEARAGGEIAMARASFTAARAKCEVAERLLEEQRKDVESVQRLFDAGEIDLLSLSSAKVEYDVSASARLDALVEAQQAFGALEQAARATSDGWKPRLPGRSVESAPKRSERNK